MITRRTAVVALAGLATGCLLSKPAEPSLTIFTYDGVEFHGDGLGLMFDDAVIVRDQLTTKVELVFPANRIVDMLEMTPEILDERYVECLIDSDDGQETLMATVNQCSRGSVKVQFVNGVATQARVRGDIGGTRGQPAMVRMNGHDIALPASHLELENTLGKPDSIRKVVEARSRT